MATAFQHRLILIVPTAKVAAVTSWFAANIGPSSVPAALGPGLSASGSAPATHAWMCGSYNDAECKAILAKLCQLAAVTPPTAPQWAGWTQAQKISWLASVRAGILSGYGAYVTLCDNTGAWDDPTAALTAVGLRPASVAMLGAPGGILTDTNGNILTT
jgi:hypothetical protein